MMIADVLLFVRIAETLSFKEAAKHLSISRSQASKRIAALEDELGTTLIAVRAASASPAPAKLCSRTTAASST
jgi:DNA-binding transcriptional LysR family regulator